MQLHTIYKLFLLDATEYNNIYSPKMVDLDTSCKCMVRMDMIPYSDHFLGCIFGSDLLCLICIVILNTMLTMAFLENRLKASLIGFACEYIGIIFCMPFVIVNT